MKNNDLSLHPKPFEIILTIILVAVVAGLSLFIGSATQWLSIKYLAVGIAILGLWFFYATQVPINLQSTILIVALYLIRPLEISFYLVLTLLLFVLIAELLKKPKLSITLPYPTHMTILVGFGIVSASKISNPLGVSFFVGTVIAPLIILTLFSNARFDDSMLEKWMKNIVWVAVFVAAYGIFIAIQNPFKRLGSFWYTAMTINGFYTMGFFFALSLGLRSNKRIVKYLYAAAALCIMFGMLYTYTRMAILAVAFGMFLFMWKAKRMRLLGIVLLGLIPLVIPSSMVTRIEIGFQNDISLIIRGIAWYYAVGQIIKHPFTGMGFSVWSDWYYSVVPLKMLYAQHCHNVYINLLVEMGVFGTLAYFYIIVSIIRRFWKRRIMGNSDLLSFGMWVAVVALLFACITDIFIQQYSVSVLFWFSLGIMMCMSKEPKKA